MDIDSPEKTRKQKLELERNNLSSLSNRKKRKENAERNRNFEALGFKRKKGDSKDSYKEKFPENRILNSANKERLRMVRAEVKRGVDEAENNSNTYGEALGSLSRASRGGIAAPVEALKLAHSFRQKVKDHDNSPYIVLILVAVAADFADFLWIAGVFGKLLLFYFLWGKGTLKVKIILRALLFIDCIPFVGWLPLSTISVLYAWRNSHKEAEEAKEKLEKMNKKGILEEEYSEAA